MRSSLGMSSGLFSPSDIPAPPPPPPPPPVLPLLFEEEEEGAGDVLVEDEDTGVVSVEDEDDDVLFRGVEGVEAAAEFDREGDNEGFRDDLGVGDWLEEGVVEREGLGRCR